MSRTERGEENQGLTPAAITDTGREREFNEDRFAVIESDSGVAWVVCDGMGGVTGGELAAQLAIDAMRRDLTAKPGRASDEAVSAALAEANRIIVLRRQNQAFSRMGTTAVMALFQGEEVALSHVGDSRAYLVRGGVIQQLTTDHTYVQSLVDSGEISLHEALSHPDAHILTRCIGSQPGLELDLLKFWIWPTSTYEDSDFLLLVTDGLYSMVADQEIAELVQHHDPQSACAKMVDLANARGGYDNITAVIVPIKGQLRSEPPPNFVRKDVSGVESGVGESALSLTRWIVIAVVLSLILLGVVGMVVLVAVGRI